MITTSLSFKNNPLAAAGTLNTDFTIPSTQGVFDTQQIRGTSLFLVFGFSHCGGVCPLVLNTLKKVVQKINKKNNQKVKVLFISVDYKRDSIQQKFPANGMFFSFFIKRNVKECESFCNL